MSDSTPTLEPCPFCGSAEVVANPDARHVMLCDNCEAQGPRISFGEPRSAAERWNTRAALDASGNDERWQPIETAPHCTRILLATDCGVVAGMSDTLNWSPLLSDDDTFVEPTHWQPLPEPPAAIARTQEQSRHD